MTRDDAEERQRPEVQTPLPPATGTARGRVLLLPSHVTRTVELAESGPPVVSLGGSSRGGALGLRRLAVDRHRIDGGAVKEIVI